MSHYAVLVRVPADAHPDEFKEILDDLLFPYNEQGDADDPEFRKFLEFEDEEEEHLKQYETDTSSMVKLPNGEVVCAYSERFRNPKLFDEPRYIYPEGSLEYQVPHKERFASFEDFMEQYCGYRGRDEIIGHYGHWRNPNAKWDWWSIGGRWTGHFAINYDPSEDRRNYKQCFICHGTGTRADTVYKETDIYCRQPTPAGHPVIGRGCNCCRGTGWEFKHASEFVPVGNYTRISELDWHKINAKALKSIDEFWDSWQEFVNGKKFDFFDGPRDRAMRLGLLECKDNSELTGDEWKVLYWDDENTPEDKRRNRCDVLRETTKDWLIDNCFETFLPISTWAILDGENGWQEKGKMGWWACSDATPESSRELANKLVDWINSGNQYDWLIIVDCHI